MKTYQKLIAGGLIVAISAGATFAYAGAQADAGESSAASVGVSNEVKFAVTKTQSGLETEKKEMVYVFTGTDGAQQKVIVTDTVTNPEGLASFSDVSSLSDIVNVKGSETFTQDGGTLTWQADGSDICYRGTTQQEAPVGVKVTYYLDGTELSAQELAGKSGKVTIRFDYYNNQKGTAVIGGKEEEVIVPFAMVTAVLLDQEKFENIEVTHGKLLKEGNVCAVVLVGMPGVAETLGLSSELAADYAEITADMADFSLTNTFTVATNSPFAALTLDGEANLDSLSDALTKLSDATQQLVDGSKELFDGAGELLNGAKELADGAGTLSDGTAAVSDNMETLASGAGRLEDGAKTLEDGVKSFTEGVNSAKEGSAALAQGAEELKSGAAQLTAGMETAAAGAGELAQGSGELKNGASQVEEGAKSLNAGMGQLQSGIASLDAGVDTAYASLAATISYNQQVLDGLTAIAAVYGEGLDAQTAASLQTLIGTLQQTIAAQQQIADSMTGEGALKSGVETLSVAAGQLSEGAQALESGSSALAQGAEALDNGIGELVGGLPQLTEGFGTLSDGIGQLSEGASELDDGLAQLKTAGGQLTSGAGSLYDAAGQLSEGAQALSDGCASLKEGAEQLSDGAKELVSGAQELASGAGTLSDGMAEYSREGIGKVLSALEDADLTSVYEKFAALLDAAAEYKSFTGVRGDMDGSVTFLIRTESIETE